MKMFKAEMSVGCVEKMCVESGKIEDKFVETKISLNRLLIVENLKIVEQYFPTLSGQPVIWDLYFNRIFNRLLKDVLKAG